MRKLVVLFIISLFLISLIPATFAEAGTTAAKRAAISAAKITAAEDEEAPGKVIAPVIRALKAAKLENLTKREAFAKYSKNLEFKARALSKIKLERARANFLRAKENFLKARERYQNAHQKFSDAKVKVKECEDKETEECDELREQIRGHAKDSLLAIADRILEHLDKLKAKVEANEDLSEEEAAEIIAKIDEQIAAVEEAKATIETSETKDEIVDAAKTLKRAWNKIKARVKLNTARTINARIGGIIVKSKQLEVKLERILERMAEAGKDTSEIEPLIEEFNAEIESAKENYEAALEKFNQAKETTPPDTELVKEGQTLMKDAHKALQEANKKLRDIIHSIKEAGGEDELEEEDEVESEEGDEEDDDEEEGGDSE